MAEDPMRAKARSTFGKSFMDAAKPRPLAKDAATASQKVANQRPIPTYKVGGPVKKADGGVMPGRIAARMAAGNYKDGGETYDYKSGGKVQTSADTARKLATEMGGMKDGGSCGMKPVKKAVGGAGKTRKGCAPIKRKQGGSVQGPPNDTPPPSPRESRHRLGSMGDVPGAGSGGASVSVGRVGKGVTGMVPGSKTAGKGYGVTARVPLARGGPARGPGGMPREGVSTPPVTPSGRRATIDDLNQSNRDVGGMSAGQVRAAGEAIGRGNRTPREKPVPKAKGGAAKVRKGMMSQSGDIKQAVKPKKGIGGFM